MPEYRPASEVIDVEQARALLHGPIRQLGPDLEARAAGQALLAEVDRLRAKVEEQHRVIEFCTRKPGHRQLPANLICWEYLMEGKVPDPR